MKNLFTLSIIIFLVPSLTSCTESQDLLVENSYNIDGWHVIEFKKVLLIVFIKSHITVGVLDVGLLEMVR